MTQEQKRFNEQYKMMLVLYGVACVISDNYYPCTTVDFEEVKTEN